MGASVMAFTPCPEAWRRASEQERIEVVRPYLKDVLEPVRFEGLGRLVLRLREPLPTVERGRLLLDLERRLRREVEPCIEVMLEPRGDVNKLRLKLRGVKT